MYQAITSAFCPGITMKCDTIQELERFLQIQEQALGKASPEIAITISKLANLYTAACNYQKAVRLHERALEIRMLQACPNQGEVEDSRRSIERLSKLKQNADKPGKEKRDKVKNSGAQNPADASSHPQSEEMCKSKVSDSDSIKEMELEVSILKQMVGSEHPAVAYSLTKLAHHYCQAKLYAHAEPALLEALRIREAICGCDHPNISTELKNLAQLYIVLKKYTLAEPLLKRALGLREKYLGSSDTRVADVKEQYAKLLRKMERVVEAENLEKEIKKLRKEEGIRPNSVEQVFS
jgi:tetratricopeptide (TPR) repeat protein